MYVCTSYLGVLVMIATNGQPGAASRSATYLLPTLR